MNNQTETIKPDAVSNDVGTATNVASPESVPAVADKPKSVKLELSEEEADMIQTLLNDYVLAYRSDRSVDYKPEPVPREKVGQYPYVATAPAPEIINPTYDWINKKWYSKNGTQSLPVIAENVADLSRKSAAQDQAALANDQQEQMITQQLGAQAEQSKNIMTMMGQMQQTLAILAKNSQSTSQTGTQTTPVKPTTNPTVNTNINGGKN